MALLFEYMKLQGRKHIRDGTQSHPLDVVGVVAGPTGIVVHVPLEIQSSISSDRKGTGKCGAEYTLDGIVAPDLNINKVMQLLQKGFLQDPRMFQRRPDHH